MMISQEILLLFITLFAFAIAVILVYRTPPPRRVEWYERGIGGYAIEGGNTYPVPEYLYIEINPFDYPFSRMPSGTFNPRQPYRDANIWLGALLGLTGLGWTMVNVPSLFTIAVIYFVFMLLATIVLVADYLSPEYMSEGSMVVTGYGAWDGQAIMGVLTGVAFIFLNYILKLSNFEIGRLQIEGFPIASFIIIVLIIPLVEELVFRGVVGMSFGEQFGWVPGIFGSAVIFSVFHAYVYQLQFIYMFLAFVFGLIAQFIDYKFKSLLPSIVAHVVVNGFSLI